MRELDEHYQNVRSELQALRASLSDFLETLEYLEWFDEYVRENELGLALATLRDFRLAPTTSAPSAEVLSRIEILHNLMEMTDSCVQRLRDKAQRSGGPE